MTDVAPRDRAMVFPGLRRGLKGERRVTVAESMTTTHAGGHILTTPSMIMEMEVMAQGVAQPFLPLDHTTVGYEICIRHRRPTAVGEWFTVEAELLEVDGRRLVFRVEARNARDQIGEGTLRRTIVRLGTLG
jgi:predicted thioesterase